jgi:hypothetical protein
LMKALTRYYFGKQKKYVHHPTDEIKFQKELARSPRAGTTFWGSFRFTLGAVGGSGRAPLPGGLAVFT